MKQILIAVAIACSLGALTGFAEDVLKPYTLAGIEQGKIDAVQASVSASLQEKGFTIAGDYSPMEDGALSVICITHPLLRKNAAEAGGLLGFSAVLRVGLCQTTNGIEVAYTTPAYWGNAYYRNGFAKVEADYATLDQHLQEALSSLSGTVSLPYGSKKGLSAKKLQKYHYMMSMPHFDDVVVLQKKLPYGEAIKRAKTRTASSASAKIVYAVEFPEQEMALLGVALTGEDGEKVFLPKIDITEPRATPFLPYEMLVLKDRTVMLHGKYRIALSFPDLSMGTFMKIVSTPGNIADALRALVKNEK